MTLHFRAYRHADRDACMAGIAAGLDEVEMRMELNEVSRAMIEHEWRRIVG